MQTKPAGWPADSAVEVVPEAFLVLPGSSWPPASGGTPAGTAELATWSVDRELTGSNLPGQVRGASGFSVATGSVTFPQPDAQLVPWGQGVQAIGPGGKARLVMSHAGPTSTGLQLGSFIVQPISGANNDPAVSLDLAEDSISLRRRVNLPVLLALPSQRGTTARVETAWVLDQVARSGGYRQVPDPAASCIWAAPCTGSPYLAAGTTTEGPAKWSEYAGNITWQGPGTAFAGEATTEIPNELFVTVDRAGTGSVNFVIRGVSVLLFSDKASAQAGGTTVFAPYPTAPPPGLARVQVHVDFAGKRIRSRANQSAWSGWVAFTGTVTPAGQSAEILMTGTGADIYARGAQVHTADDPKVWAEPTARIAPTGSMLDAVIIPDARDGWGLVQEITAATQGAAWVDEAGIFNYRGYETLRGVGAVTEAIEAMDSLESLRWRVDPADVADRVELTYTPADTQRVKNQSLTVWEAIEPIRVLAGRTAILNVDIEGAAVDSLAGWLPIWDTTPNTRYSRWAAATSREGGGTQPADTALQITAEMVTPSRARISITNTTNTTLWTVDGNGNTVLILRADVVARMGEPRTISSGTSEAKSLAPLDVDLGVWVQDDEAAQRYLAWLTGQTTKAKATIEQVRVKPNLARQLGDVAKLTDGITGLSAKALVTGVHLSGEHGSYTQILDLALLDFIWADMDAALARLGLNTFQQLDDYLATNNINTFADFDNWLNTLEGAQ